MHHVYENTVASVKEAPLIVALIAKSQGGWCQQFSEEGYTVLHIAYPDGAVSLNTALDAAGERVKDSGRLWSIVTYGLLDDGAISLSRLVSAAGDHNLEACAHYAPLVQDPVSLLIRRKGGQYIQTLVHLATAQEALHAALQNILTSDMLPAPRTTAEYPALSFFAYPLVPATPPFPFSAKPPALVTAGETGRVDPHVRSAVSLAYTRTLDLLRRQTGPHFDTEKLWDQHTYFEFVERDSAKTMATMVKVPYVNSVPILTGGVGYEDLARFYKYHFTAKDVTPPDFKIITVSRTVGSERIIDEMVAKFTHTTELDYFLPGIKPTGKPVEIAVVGVVAFRGDKLTFEHIYWDQASTLVQIGILDPKTVPAIAGVEVARKVLDPFGYPSNELLSRWKESEGLSID